MLARELGLSACWPPVPMLIRSVRPVASASAGAAAASRTALVTRREAVRWRMAFLLDMKSLGDGPRPRRTEAEARRRDGDVRRLGQRLHVDASSFVFPGARE